jgi:hypothetical protein
MASQVKRRCQSVLLWAVGSFLITHLVGGLLLDYCWPLVRFPSGAAVLDSLSRMPDPRMVLLGSSRVAIGISQGEVATLVQRQCHLDKPYWIFNAAVPAGDSITMEFLLGELLQRGVKPDWIVVEVSPETLSEYNEWLGVHVRRQLRWDHVPAYLVQTCRAGQGLRLLSARFFSLFFHRQQILEETGTTLSHWFESICPRRPDSVPRSLMRNPRKPDRGPIDWECLLEPPEREVTRELRDRIEHTAQFQLGRWLRHFRIAGSSPRALESILRLCQQHKIGVLLIRMPVTAAHRSKYTPQMEQEFEAYLTGLLERYPIRSIDCRDWLADGLFVDNHHLHAKGQEHFSRLLTYHVLLPLLQDQPFTRPARKPSASQGL